MGPKHNCPDPTTEDWKAGTGYLMVADGADQTETVAAVFLPEEREVVADVGTTILDLSLIHI